MSGIKHHFKRLPAEWEPQTAILLTWPHERGGWGRDYAHAERTFVEIAKTIATTQQVIIGVENARHQTQILDLLKLHHTHMEHIFTYITPSNDVWARDHGPITVFEGMIPTLYDFQFNGWGNKYDASLDDQITSHLFQANLLKGYALKKVDFILEGGSIESDGHGTILTTSQCLQNINRHPHASKQSLEKVLSNYFGIKQILWIDSAGLLGDDTDGHIDTLARFVDPRTIAYVACEDKTDPNYASLKAMYQTLTSFRDLNNVPYHLVALPSPRPIFDQQGKRLPATYANFLITNTHVLVPTYQDSQDQHVLSIFERCFPERTIVGIDCLSIIEQYGSLHCLTMQIPSPS